MWPGVSPQRHSSGTVRGSARTFALWTPCQTRASLQTLSGHVRAGASQGGGDVQDFSATVSSAAPDAPFLHSGFPWKLVFPGVWVLLGLSAPSCSSRLGESRAVPALGTCGCPSCLFL